jgi:type IV pilus assembly protein PilA
MKKVQQGFTLIELMIVVAIIGILAAVAGPMYLDYTVRSQVAEGLQLSSSAKAATTEFFQDRGRFPTDNSEAGLAADVEIQGKFVALIAVADNVITVQYGNDVNLVILGQTITLTADTTSEGSIRWDCASGGVIQDKHLPAACR